MHPAVFEGGLFDIGAGDQVLALFGVKDVLHPAPVAVDALVAKEEGVGVFSEQDIVNAVVDANARFEIVFKFEFFNEQIDFFVGKADKVGRAWVFNAT